MCSSATPYSELRISAFMEDPITSPESLTAKDLPSKSPFINLILYRDCCMSD